jgi:hypothetical protein
MQYPTSLKDMAYDRHPQGYVDAWAGGLLKRRVWLPFARGRFLATHPEWFSQNQVEEQVPWAGICCVRQGTPVLAVGDRGSRRTGMFRWLLDRKWDDLFRMRSDINVTHQGRWCHVLRVAREVKG